MESYNTRSTQYINIFKFIYYRLPGGMSPQQAGLHIYFVSKGAYLPDFFRDMSFPSIVGQECICQHRDKEGIVDSSDGISYTALDQG